jgi:hypothetical protein
MKLGKENPYLKKIGDSNDRATKGNDYVWALQDTILK